ncbi:DUF4112 domain-containing protein [Roseococcus sp. SYP-B2431]|uniref:DUF4112 domain-containing protein n=1 Tax=Roseococcus sp. SYP-B2431 TaxID=2496640 RepID=UPI001F10D32B|nr:DUF4112 domain-containing protein [Roseococcus sp. SYP-B2431]
MTAMTSTAAAAWQPKVRLVSGTARLDLIADLLDSRWRIPGTGIRFGADALLSLIPAAGPAISTALSGYLIWEAHRLGASRGLLARMIANVGLDAAISSVPLVGAVGDVFFRANRRNMALLRQHRARTAGSR